MKYLTITGKHYISFHICIGNERHDFDLCCCFLQTIRFISISYFLPVSIEGKKNCDQNHLGAKVKEQLCVCRSPVCVWVGPVRERESVCLCVCVFESVCE